MLQIVAFDAFLLYLFLSEDINIDIVNFFALSGLRTLRIYSPKYFILNILKMFIMKMIINFMLNEHVISNQRTLVFLLCIHERQ